MPLNLTDAQLNTIANELFLLKSPAPVKLSPPTNVGARLAVRMAPIAANQRFWDLGIGVVDFTANVMAPEVWLLNGGDPWRIGSTGKIAILLAAVQLRDDVRKVEATGFVPRDDFDELFASARLWGRSPDSGVKEIANRRRRDGTIEERAPRISTIFGLAQPPAIRIDFIGAPVIDRAKLTAFVHASGPFAGQHRNIFWSEAPDLTFWERLWLTGALSDNVAATSCISEIGIAYMKAVQRAYGLSDSPRGMHLFLADGYIPGGVDTNQPVSRSAGAPPYRKLLNPKYTRVKDIWMDRRTRTESQLSTQPGSAAALTAYMIALIQNKLVGPGAVGIDGCNTIRTHLADGKPGTLSCLIQEGVERVVPVLSAHTKIGVLHDVRIVPSVPAEYDFLQTEFAYLDTGSRQFAVLVTGIQRKRVPGLGDFEEDVQGKDLGEAIFRALFP